MGEVDFADGFDISEPLLWGLTPAQLGTIVAGVALGYLAFRSPLPHAAGVAIGIVLAACALGISTLRVEGRTLLAWLGAAARWYRRPRAGLIVIEGGAGDHAASSGRAATTEGLRSGRVLDGAAIGDPHGFTRGCELRTQRLVFFSLAGGSGRTTLAVEVATLLAQAVAGQPVASREFPQVALVDLDLLSPRASLRLGVPLATDWQDLVDAGAGERLAALHRTGLRVLPGPAGTGDGRFTEDPRLLARLETLLRKLELKCETLIIDIPAGLGPVARWAFDAADVIAVVLTPTAGGVQDAYRSTEALRRLGHARKIRYVVNGGDDVSVFDEAMADLGGAVLGCVPDDTELTRAEAEHRLVALSGDTATASSLRALAAQLAASIQPEAAAAVRLAPLLGAGRPREREAG